MLFHKKHNEDQKMQNSEETNNMESLHMDELDGVSGGVDRVSGKKTSAFVSMDEFDAGDVNCHIMT